MKKFIATVLTVVMLLSMTVFANGAAQIFPLIKSGAATSEFTIECDAIGLIPGIGMITFLDPEYFINGLSGVKVKSDEKYDINDDYTRIIYSSTFDMDIPLDFNANLQIGTRMKAGIWFEYDVTDETNPLCRAVFATPIDRRYIVVDVVEELGLRGYDIDRIASDFKKYINKEKIEEYVQKINDMMMSNATVTEGKNSLTLTLSGEQYLNFAKEMLDYFAGILADYDVLAQEFGVDFNTEEAVPEGMNMEMVLQMNYDSKGEMVDSDAKFTVSLDEELAEDAGIKSFSFGGSSVYSGINLPISIEFPELTEENSVMYYDMTGYGYCDWIHINCSYIPATDETFYVPVSEVMTKLRECGHKYTVENRSGKVVITNTDGVDNFDTLEFTVGLREFKVDSENFVSVNPVVYKNGALFVDNYLLEKAFGYTYSDARTELISGITVVTLERQCPDNVIEESVYDDYDDSSYEDTGEEYEYCWHYENLWIPVDYPDFNNDYFGLRAVIDNHMYANGYYGQIEMTYDNGVVTIVNNGENTYFKTATVTVGSNIVNVDGTEYQTAVPAVNKDGKVYIDKDAIKAIMKYELKRINLVYPSEEGGTYKSADFERIIPGCTHDYEETKWYSSFYYDYY